MNYEKMSRAMRYHYGNEKNGRRGHLAMVKEKRLYYRSTLQYNCINIKTNISHPGLENLPSTGNRRR